ncbi:MAG: class I SAM-dependent methyltransferase [Desulfobacterales bacterium]|nr:class I SAM-dependent methyltransferase [Desulfobacterales bacterium]
MAEQTGFDSKAKDWDKSDKRRATIGKIADKIKETGVLSAHSRVMDFGAGSGLLTLELRRFAGHVTAVDTSREMLARIKEKQAASHIDNVSTLHQNLEREAYPGEKVHLVVSSMTMHHLDDPAAALRTLFDALLDNGRMMIADLEHEEAGEGRAKEKRASGFGRERLKALCLKAGFTSVSDETLLTYEKRAKDGKKKTYTLFLLTAEKGST